MQKHPALFRYKYIPYPCNGGTRVAYFFRFSIPLVSPFRIWYRTGLPPIPGSLERLQYTYSSYLNDLVYSAHLFLYTKREYSSYRKDGYSRGATLIRYKCNAL
ncbi:hypothetical protein EMIT079MI2_60223 [Bacillus sp. IT-79MI2]